MVRIAITGGIACGKTVVGKMLESGGLAVLEADELAHGLVERGRPAYEEVVGAFGPGILSTDGRIDRRKLGDIVFSDAGARKRLNAIVHPRVNRAMQAWFTGLGTEQPAAAAIVPLLFEAGLDRGWDAVICVSASEEDQNRRLVVRGLTLAEAKLRIEAQWPLIRKAELSDYVLVNNGSLELLEEQTTRVLQRIMKR
jgi:dephospho-CoA kinase